jgi:tetratricopeptide (TPR) repeat protein
VQIPNKSRLKRRTSIPNKLDFDAFKRVNNFEQSRLHTEPDLPPSVRANLEKEWAREVWTVWFDEVIPQLDGTGGRAGRLLEEAAKKKQQQLLSKSSSNMSGKSDKLGVRKEAEEEEEDEGDGNNRRIAKSPTPYDTFDQINLDQIGGEMIRTLELEIQVLTERIQTRTTCFDLCRRGALYRKLGFVKLALDDLNRALELERHFIDALWQRHLIYLVQDKKMKALDDLNIILKMNRHHAGAYLSRFFFFFSFLC